MLSFYGYRENVTPVEYEFCFTEDPKGDLRLWREDKLCATAVTFQSVFLLCTFLYANFITIWRAKLVDQLPTTQLIWSV